MKPLIMLFLLFIFHALTTGIIPLNSNREEMRKLDRELDIKDRGVMYYFPITRG